MSVININNMLGRMLRYVVCVMQPEQMCWRNADKAFDQEKWKLYAEN